MATCLEFRRVLFRSMALTDSQRHAFGDIGAEFARRYQDVEPPPDDELADMLGMTQIRKLIQIGRASGRERVEVGVVGGNRKGNGTICSARCIADATD